MGEVVYRSAVDVERARGALRYAHLPAEEGAVAFGVHGAIAAHYGAADGTFEPHATTLDYVVAAAAGWLTGTFGGALEARHIPAGDGRLRSHAVGEIELEDKVLVIKRIHVRYELRVSADADRAAIDRALEAHPPRCPVARSIGGCIDITTELHLIDDTGWPGLQKGQARAGVDAIRWGRGENWARIFSSGVLGAEILSWWEQPLPEGQGQRLLADAPS